MGREGGRGLDWGVGERYETEIIAESSWFQQVRELSGKQFNSYLSVTFEGDITSLSSGNIILNNYGGDIILLRKSKGYMSPSDEVIKVLKSPLD